MHIGVAVWSSVLQKTNQKEYVEVLLSSVAALSPEHTLILITDEADFALPTNVNRLQVPLVSSYFGLRRWYGKTLPTIIKKESVNALITIDSGPVNSPIPQLPLFISPPLALKTCNTWLQFFYKKYLVKRLQKAGIGVMASQQKQEMKKLLGVKEEQIFTVGYAVSAAYQPIDDWQQREAFLQHQTGGREYFLYTGHFVEEQFLQVLKAFSLFKKRQQSNMQLLVPGRFSISKKLQEKIDTYKYRQDVQLLNTPDESLLPQLMACAYAVLFTPENSTTAWPVAAAMQCHVPVIGAENNAAVKDIADSTALYIDATPESLAEQMKRIYKDEALRQSLIFHSHQQAKLVSGRQAAQNILTHFSVK